MRDEPADRANAELLERLRARGAHEAHAAHRLVKPERGLQPIGYVESFRQNFLSQWKQTSFHFNVENAASGGRRRAQFRTTRTAQWAVRQSRTV